MFNAAFFRNPSNVSEIKSDLSELCRHFLKISNANNQTADLIKKREQVKNNANELRKEVWKFLSIKVPKIRETSSTTKLTTLSKHQTLAIQELNKFIARKYKQTMAELSQYCDGVIGKAPCVYAIV